MVSLGVFYKKRVGYSSDITGANDYMYDYDEFDKGIFLEYIYLSALQ